MASYKVEQIPDPRLDLGEGPHWDSENQSLFYVNLFEATIHRLDYKHNKVYSATVEGCTFASFVIPVKGRKNELVVGDGTRLVLVSWNGISGTAQLIKVLADLGEKAAGHRWNDGKVDSRGRLYAGTMIIEDDGKDPFKTNSGCFYRYDAKTASFVEQFSGLFVSNGLAWNDKSKQFYFVDSGTNDIKRFDVDAAGNLVNGKVFFDLKKIEQNSINFFDGMTIDTDGNLYVAVFHGSKVVKINSNGKIIQEIQIPAKQVTSVAFGGPNLDELFVTTAKKQVIEPQHPPAGATFKVTGLGTRGTAMNAVEL
ncbi:regucalcin-like [Malaya genurostris]|uniref:regucalcin-like n=1 Tax=Malaya genurostris TaxID=325434 RepID=UPI0026F3B8B3|nr:regucalcin-like [Malaya genurostris]